MRIQTRTEKALRRTVGETLFKLLEAQGRVNKVADGINKFGINPKRVSEMVDLQHKQIKRMYANVHALSKMKDYLTKKLDGLDKEVAQK